MKKDVVRLQVSVHHILYLNKSNGDSLKDFSRLRLRNTAPLLQQAAKAAFRPGHHDEVLARISVETRVQGRYDMGKGPPDQCIDHLNLPEPGGRSVYSQTFDCYWPAVRIGSVKDLAKASRWPQWAQFVIGPRASRKSNGL